MSAELFEAMLCTFQNEQLATIKQAGFYSTDLIEQPLDQSEAICFLAIILNCLLFMLSYKPYY